MSFQPVMLALPAKVNLRFPSDWIWAETVPWSSAPAQFGPAGDWLLHTGVFVGAAPAGAPTEMVVKLSVNPSTSERAPIRRMVGAAERPWEGPWWRECEEGGCASNPCVPGARHPPGTAPTKTH